MTVFGLGNPGPEYRLNRHNVGFMVVDAIASAFDAKFRRDSIASAESASFTLGNRKVILLKPMTFMNCSGKAVMPVVNFYKIRIQNVFVFHDDIDIPFGRVRVKCGGGHGGHNGLKSIDANIGKDYWRVRIGVGRPVLKDMVVSHVLGNFSDNEVDKLHNVLNEITSRLEEVLFKPNDWASKINTLLEGSVNN